MSKLQLKTKNFILGLTGLLFFSILFFFLSVNILFSQSISPLYFQIVKDDRHAAVSFLNKIKNLPSFPSLLDMNKNIYGNQIGQEVFAGDKKRKETIKRLESLLQKNPKSRDLLYNLSLLYKEDRNTVKAEQYLQRAKEIDPSINNFQYPITNYQ